MGEKDDDELIAQNLTTFTEHCSQKQDYQFMFVTLDLLSLVLGQPLTARLLWIALTSKQLDILSSNLALFHNLLYCFLCSHMFVIFLSPPLMEKLHDLIFIYVQVGGPMQLCFICLERFIAVIHPTYFPLLKKYKCREISAALVWITSLPLAVVYTVPGERLESRQVLIEKLPAFLMISLSCIMVFTSYKVAKTLRNSPVGKDSLHPAKRRAFITICGTSAVAMSCYIPVMFLGNLKMKITLNSCALIPLCIFLLSIGSLVHPLFYLYAKGDFNCKRCCKKPS